MDELALLQKKLHRERMARKQAEALLENKAGELYQSNQSLLALNQNLEKEISDRVSELKESEFKYRTLIEQASDIIYNVDEEGYFTFINQTGIRKFGYTEEELLGKRYVDFVPTEYQMQVFEYYTNFKEDQTESDYYEFPVTDKSGRRFWLGQNVNRINRADGSFYYAAVARDISQRKRTEEALEVAQFELTKSEIKYRSIIENMELGLLEVDTEGTIVRAYPLFNKMTGYADGELEGKNAKAMLMVEEYDSLVDEQGANRQKGETGVYEMRIKKKDGSEIWVIISGAPFYNEKEEIVGSIGIHYDITDQKRLEQDLIIARQEAEQAQAAEKLFLSRISHEMRTPLNAVIGMSQLLKETEPTAVQRDYLGVLNNSADILKNLISDILDLSKVDADSIELNLAPMDIKASFTQIIKSFEISADSIDFGCTVDANIRHTIITDTKLLTQVMVNLIGNAVKFTEGGRIDTRVSIADESEEKLKLLIEVEDTGIGIAEEDVDRIFEKFRQSHAHDPNQKGGTGLGLAISKRIVNLLGGDLRVDSYLGEGSNFFFEIEVKKGELIQASINTADSIVKPVFDQPIHILVAEDNLHNIKYLHTLLDKWKISYDTAMNGVEAIELFKDNDYALVLMDIQMPVMDGLTATKVIRELPVARSKYVPIIALTASSVDSLDLPGNNGITDFVTKPFTPAELGAAIMKYGNQEIKDTSSNNLNNYSFHDQLDADYLTAAYGDNLDAIADMIDSVCKTVTDEIDALHHSINEKDIEDIQRRAHKLAPIYTMVGVPSMTATMSAIEDAAKESNLEKINILFKVIQKDINIYLPILQVEFQKLQSYLATHEH